MVRVSGEAKEKRRMGESQIARKAVVLAAGLGTRLRPLTCATPKPLMPVWGEPMLARIVAMLRGWGVDDIVVNCHYLHEQVEAWCAANGCRASYEPEILGTGGVLNPLREWIGGDEFYLVNGDIVLEGLERNPLEIGPGEIGCCLLSEEGPRTIEAEPERNLITCWKSPDPGWDGTFTYCGVARLRPEILEYVEPKGFSTIVAAYEKAMMAGRFVRGVRPEGLLWTDAGTVASYIDLNRDGDENAFADFPQLKAAGVTGIEFLGARGSDRCFFKTAEGIAVVYDDAKRGENAKYARLARWLGDRGIPVPAVVKDLPELKVTVFENVGATDLAAKSAQRGVGVIGAYGPVVETLAKFNGLGGFGSLGLEPAFDAGLWAWERDLFREHCLGTRFGRPLPDAVAAELEQVAARLEREPKALVHRDFQSSNVIWRNDAFSFIDFQGMREDPAVYDLASLLYDPYVKLAEREREALAALYGKACGRPEIVKTLPFAAVQRLVQCLGAYGRLASVGQPRFGAFVLPALENLLSAADEAGLDATGALAEELIADEERLYGGGAASCSCGHACGHDHREHAG